MGRKSKAPRGSRTDALRDEFESSREWKLRKTFLDANVGSLSADRLVCLSKCFVNTALYGCSYPRPVMEEIRARSGQLLEDHQQRAKEDRVALAKTSFAARFVRASDDAAGSGPAGQDAHRAGETVLPPSSTKTARDGSSTTDVEIVDLAQLGQDEAVVQVGESEEGCQEGKPSGSDASDQDSSAGAPAGDPLLSLEEYTRLWESETDRRLKKLRHLACSACVSGEKDATRKVQNLRRELKVCIRKTWDLQLAKRLGVNCVVRILLDEVHVGSGAADTRNGASRAGFQSVLQKVYLPHLRLNPLSDGRVELQASSRPFPEGAGQDRHCILSGLQDAPIGCPLLPAGKKACVAAGLDNNKKTGKKKKSGKEKNLEAPKEAEVVVAAEERATTQTESNQSNISHQRSARRKPVRSCTVVEALDSELTVNRETAILRHSADFSDMLLEFDLTVHASARVTCVVRLEGQTIAEARDTSKKTAKQAASVKALAYLRHCCWVLKLKGTDVENSISKDELFREVQKQTDAIGEGNVGNKLLRKMGWTGGGMGRHGSGIVEPVSAAGVLGRSGLGLAASACADERAFRRQMAQALRKYVASGEQEDLRFSTDFSKEERKVIHEEAARLRLRTASRGKGDDRFMTVGRKRSTQELLRHVRESGGETKNYILLPPGSAKDSAEKSSEG